jgi:hypothetical protein
MLVRRRVAAAAMAAFALAIRTGWAQPRRVAVTMQVDGGTASSIPGDERAGIVQKQDRSPSAAALDAKVPPGRAIPLIYLVVGMLSLPVIWNTIREMLRRDYYGGVIIDTRGADVSIKHDPAVPAEMVFVIQQDGTVQKFAATDFSETVLQRIVVTRIK